eukprot:Gb_20408 [translate_table: standard]
MEGKHVTDHHQHHHQSAGNGHRAQESHGVWVCHQCGWTYPNPHPSAKHRRNHRKHCGKIEGFPLISTGERETRGGSSDEELSDKEHKSTDAKQRQRRSVNASFGHVRQDRTTHESRSLEIKGFLLQAEASAAISGSSSSDLNLTSKETVLGKAIQKVWAPANASISTSQITVLDGKVTGSDQSGGIGRETSKQFSTPSVDAGTETMGPLGHSTGGDGLSFEQKSNSFLKEGPHADSYHNAIGRFGHVDFPVKGHSVVSEYPGLKTQYRQADERVLPLSEEHVLPVIEGHPEFSDNADGLGLQITNGTSKQHTEVKGSSAKLQDTGLIDHQTNVSKLVTTPTYRTMESNSGISSRKVGIASILEEASYDGPNLDEFKLEISSLEETPESADKRICKQIWDVQKGWLMCDLC